MKLRDAAYFLVGDRDAIVALAGNRWTLAVGAFLVLTASVARNYDGAYLPAEWTVLTHGYAASIGNAFVLFAAVFAFARFTDGRSFSFGKGYLAFLGLFWMTSHLAWLYAIPYERFLTPVGAIEANLWTLAAVAAWRVILISRVLSVLFDLPLLPVFLLAAFWADVILFSATQVMPAPVVDFMGGLQHTDEDALLSSVRFTVMIFSFLGMFVLGVAALIGLYWLRTIAPLAIEPVRERPSTGILAMCAAALIACAGALVYGQPEQYRRFRAESLLLAGDVAEAFAFMSRHERSAFPPIWDPPPRMGYAEESPSIEAVRAALAAGELAPWVRSIYLDKSWRAMQEQASYLLGYHGPDDYIEPVLPLDTINEAAYLELAEILRFHSEHDDRYSAEDRERFWRYADEMERKLLADSQPADDR
ncbi:MAG: hypothetical protein KIS87_07590 [Phycisphaeraceae bacterium]|nr:hypothetical protein [Phycisphaeraceae bacterium]